MITIPQLTEVQDIGDTDVVMITHSDGTSKKIAGQNILSAGTNTVMATSTSITGPALKTGMGIKVFFTVALTGSNTTTPLALTYNSVSKTVKVPKNGALVDFCAVEVSTGVYKYLQAYTTLELLYDGTNFVIIGNPVVISSADYTIYADGLKECFVTYRGNVEFGEGIDSVVLKTIPIIPKEIVTVPVVANTSYTFKNYFYVIINLSGEVILRKLTTTLNAETVTIQFSCTFLA